jgi:outer membrane scaffolding protein for murein synthesis (MipA/OmpV family)
MKYIVLFLALVLSVISTARAQSEMKPKWEIGAGVAVIDFPIYRGANERRMYLLPVPYLVYRGDTIQVDRERVRGLIFREDRLEMDISVNGSVPAKSRDTIARRGMLDLNPTLEIGPSLNAHLYYSDDKKTNFDLRLPLRKVIATDLKHTQSAGWLFQPQLDLDIRDIEHTGWNLGLVGGIIFSDQTYNKYFYDVAPQYATATRPAYTASGGYSGTQFIVALSKRHESYWTGGFMKWDDLSGAAFANSPLVKSKQYFTVGFSISWILDKSDKMVEVSND